MAKFKNISILVCMLFCQFFSNVIFAMEPLHYINTEDSTRLPVQQTAKMERGDKESETKCVCNLDICGLVESKKNDGSHYKEVCVVDTIPAMAACAMISATIFCCGCPK